jgi:hypothetical protein
MSDLADYATFQPMEGAPFLMRSPNLLPPEAISTIRVCPRSNQSALQRAHSINYFDSAYYIRWQRLMPCFYILHPSAFFLT